VNDADRKVRDRGIQRAAYFAHLDERIPELHRSGYPGRLARLQADREWARRS
jgi:hypothetical protein